MDKIAIMSYIPYEHSWHFTPWQTCPNRSLRSIQPLHSYHTNVLFTCIHHHWWQGTCLYSFN